MYTLAALSVASGLLVFAYVAGRVRQIIATRNLPMANSASAIATAFAPVAELVKNQAATIADQNSTISDLRDQLAKIDPTVSDDLAADEAAIADFIKQASDLISPQPVAPKPSQEQQAPAELSIAEQLAAAAAKAS